MDYLHYVYSNTSDGYQPGEFTVMVIVSYRVHAVATHITQELILSHINSKLESMGITDTTAMDIVNPIVDYIGEGYAQSTQEELGELLTYCLT